jgi:hypothetical protein
MYQVGQRVSICIAQRRSSECNNERVDATGESKCIAGIGQEVDHK